MRLGTLVILLLCQSCGTLVPWVFGVAATRELRLHTEQDPDVALTFAHDLGPSHIRNMSYKRDAANRDQTVRFDSAHRTADTLTLRKTVGDGNGRYHVGPALTFVRHDFDVTADGTTRSGDSHAVLFGAEAGRILVDNRLYLTARFVGGFGSVSIPQFEEDVNLPSSDLRGGASLLNFELEYTPYPWLSLLGGIAFDTIALPPDGHVNDPAPNPSAMENSIQSTTPYLGIRLHWNF